MNARAVKNLKAVETHISQTNIIESAHGFYFICFTVDVIWELVDFTHIL